MNLYEFAENVNYAVLSAVNSGIDPKFVEVGVQIVPDEGKIYGGIAVDPVRRAYRGFDWDSHKYILETESDLVIQDK